MTTGEQVLAIEAIKQLKARYFRCMDTKDWAGFLAVFTPDAVVGASEAFTPTDHTGALLKFDAVVPPPSNPAGRHNDIAKFVADLSKTLDGVSTVRHGHMPEIELTSPTTPTGIWAMEDMLRWPRGSAIRDMHGYGHYRETYELLPQGWRIKTLKLTRMRVDSTS
jgi:SnoaL-like domain